MFKAARNRLVDKGVLTKDYTLLLLATHLLVGVAAADEKPVGPAIHDGSQPLAIWRPSSTDGRFVAPCLTCRGQ